MVYTAVEIVLFMVLAAALGFGAGWFLQGARKVETIAREPLRRLPAAPIAGAKVAGDARETVDLRAIELEDEAEIALARQVVIERMERRASPAPVDDLTDIRGIGPKISNLLHGLGVTSFEQISKFTEEDIELVGAALGAFAGRIRRDDWMGSARRLEAARHASDGQ
ncbi:MAG: hypothetical protein OEM97_08960 [Acidimicrobiia bacterium]|nr:hypothetical protein [Acidimicrobiia bacterium]